MRHENPTWLDGSGAFLFAILCIIAMGLPGLIAGTVFFVLWYTLPTLYTVMFGHLVVTALTDGIDGMYLVPLEVGLLAVLVGPSLGHDRPYWRIFTTSVVAIVFGVGALALSRWTNYLWLAIIVVVLVFALTSYGLHRYERVALGLVEDTT